MSRAPTLQNFEDRSQEETEWQEQGRGNSFEFRRLPSSTVGNPWKVQHFLKISLVLSRIPVVPSAEAGFPLVGTVCERQPLRWSAFGFCCHPVSGAIENAHEVHVGDRSPAFESGKITTSRPGVGDGYKL